MDDHRKNDAGLAQEEMNYKLDYKNSTEMCDF